MERLSIIETDTFGWIFLPIGDIFTRLLIDFHNTDMLCYRSLSIYKSRTYPVLSRSADASEFTLTLRTRFRDLFTKSIEECINEIIHHNERTCNKNL